MFARGRSQERQSNVGLAAAARAPRAEFSPSPPPSAPAGRLADRIRTLRERCCLGLGEGTFERAYRYLKVGSSTKRRHVFRSFVCKPYIILFSDLAALKSRMLLSRALSTRRTHCCRAKRLVLKSGRRTVALNTGSVYGIHEGRLRVETTFFNEIITKTRQL